MNILVYCGSRSGINTDFTTAAQAVAHALADRSHGLVYGGGSIGLMGEIARTMTDRNATVIGVLPTFMKTEEVAYQHCTELLEVGSMHERKLKMLQRADGIIALPGGFGTMDELFEAVTWRQLGLHNRPIGILNVSGYYDHLSAMIDMMLAQGFISPATHGLIRFDTDILPLLDWLEHHGSDADIDPLLPRWT